MVRVMRIAMTVAATLLIAQPCAVAAAESLKLDDKTVRLNYSLGYQIGGDFKRQGVGMDPDAVVKGIEDALAGNEPLIPQEEMNKMLVELKRKVIAEQRKQQREKQHALELQYQAEGKKYLEDNAKKPGVKTTDSGLQYKVIEAGNGKTPGPTDLVTVNYKGTLTDGKVFDSSYNRGKPTTFRLNNVIKGWTEGLQLVRAGGRIELVIPPGIAYGNSGPLAHRTLIFDVELISVDGDKAPSASGETQ